MAKATSKSSQKTEQKPRKSGTAVARKAPRKESSGSQESMGEALMKLLQSPLVAELVAVAATAALASLAEQGFTSGREGSRGKRAGRAVKEAGKAAAAAVGRRLSIEIDEIRKSAKDGAAA